MKSTVNISLIIFSALKFPQGLIIAVSCLFMHHPFLGF